MKDSVMARAKKAFNGNNGAMLGFEAFDATKETRKIRRLKPS
jgi:hypothetical protein